MTVYVLVALVIWLWVLGGVLVAQLAIIRDPVSCKDKTVSAFIVVIWPFVWTFMVLFRKS